MHALSIVTDAMAEAWGYLMCLVFLPGARLGLWELRKGAEPKGSPHMTPRMGNVIMWTALAIQAGIMAVIWLKLYWLWLAGGRS